MRRNYIYMLKKTQHAGCMALFRRACVSREERGTVGPRLRQLCLTPSRVTLSIEITASVDDGTKDELPVSGPIEVLLCMFLEERFSKACIVRPVNLMLL